MLYCSPKRPAKVSPPGIEPGPRPSQGRVLFRHTPRTLLFQYPAEESNPVLQIRSLPCRPSHSQGKVSRPGLEPGSGPSEGPMLSTTPSGHVSIPTWSRTRTWTLGGSRAVRYTIGTQEPTTGLAPASAGSQDRRLAVRPRRRKHGCEESNLTGRFWRPPAPQTHTRVGLPAVQPGAVLVIYFSSSTFQYASLTNFDQLSIRTSRSA